MKFLLSKQMILKIEAKLALLQIGPQKLGIPATIPLEISNVPETEISTK